MVVDTVAYTLHTAFGALWTGSVLFVVAAVLPLAMDGDVSPDAFGRVVGTLQWVTRSSAVVLLVTGGYLAVIDYSVGGLTGTGPGYLVVAMVGLWLGLTATIEVGSAKALRGVEARKIREPARAARPFYLGAVLFAVGLFGLAGLLGRTPGFL